MTERGAVSGPNERLEFGRGLGIEDAAVSSAHAGGTTHVPGVSASGNEPDPGTSPTVPVRCPVQNPCSRDLLPSPNAGMAAFVPHPGPTAMPSRPTKNPVFAGFFESGRPDLNRGPHRPELWAKLAPQKRKSCKSRYYGSCPPPIRSSDFAVDSLGLGREIELLPKPRCAVTGPSAQLSQPASLLPRVRRPRYQTGV
jgi:hypothetical protein